MNYGLIILTIVIFLILKVIYDMLSVKSDKNMGILIRIIVCCCVAFFLLIVSLFFWLINFIKSEIDATDNVKNITETTEIFNFDGSEQRMDGFGTIESSNNLQEEASNKPKKPIKTRTIKTQIRASSKERHTSSGELVNNLASNFFKPVILKIGKEMAEKATKME